MNKQQHLMYFLGRMRGYLEEAASLAVREKSQVFDRIAEAERFFNKGIWEIFNKEDSNATTEQDILIKSSIPVKLTGKMEIEQWI